MSVEDFENFMINVEDFVKRQIAVFQENELLEKLICLTSDG